MTTPPEQIDPCDIVTRFKTDKRYFFLLYSAPRDSGKTFHYKHLLTDPRHNLLHQYDIVYVVSPTPRFNFDYDDLKAFDNVQFITTVTTDFLLDLLHKMENLKEMEKNDPDLYRAPSTLVILDDILDTKIGNFGGILDAYAHRGRHVNCAVIASIQRLNGLSRTCRINSDVIVIFVPYSASEVESFVEQFVFRAYRKGLHRKIVEIFDIPYNCIILNNMNRCLSKRLIEGTLDDFVNNNLQLIQLEIVTDPYKRSPSVDDSEPKRKQVKKRKKKVM
jgi:hypothetical protein